LKGAPTDGYVLAWRNYALDLSRRTHIIGILNVTPDSFSDGGQFFDRQEAIEHGLVMAAEGADIIDIGGESTRPYSETVSTEDEMDRVIPVIQVLARETKIPISIDTLKAEVAQEALRCGASMINDVSALRRDPDMISVAAKAGVPVILMHMKGTPEDMQKNPTYEDLIPEIYGFLEEAIKRAVDGGIQKKHIIVDPGIGFGKTFDHNLQIIRELGRFLSLGQPILLGSSRKAFIGHILKNKAHERDTGSMATIAAGILNGAHMVRVHNVRMAVETAAIVDAIKRGSADV
jgi:dihydropteroate synthase